MICCHCYNPIEAERLQIVPHTQICGGCARIFNVGKKKMGRMIYGHKTAGEIQIMSADIFKEHKKYWTPQGARSCVKNFSKNVCA